eukprot:TRINITY_DN8084_c0_g1_i1.p1 TRINITY_DN8084_c0_g1~~TRINITY_DN8084_c0_g1_i1.p1  ORF type:complete len:138 (+),score=21.78 TRINITY_DN8084_c0_g1_i1:311-724(+)
MSVIYFVPKCAHTPVCRSPPLIKTSVSVNCCAFQPAPPTSFERISDKQAIVATGGGNSICFINCGTGQCEKRYSHPLSEFFYCLAWTWIPPSPSSTSSEFVSLLAAAGESLVLPSLVSLMTYPPSPSYSYSDSRTLR